MGRIDTTVGGCTGTLIAPRVVLTAAHCFNYESREHDDFTSTFSMTASDGTALAQENIERVVSFGEKVGDKDVAIAVLSRCVKGVTPEPLAAARPPDGTTVTQFGYGCQDRKIYCETHEIGPSPGKQRLEITLGDSRAGCFGDSGGPLFTSDGIFAVDSGGYTCGTKPDIYGDSVAQRAELDRLVKIYGCSYEEADGHFLVRLQPPGAFEPDSGAGFLDQGPYLVATSKYGDLRVRAKFVTLGAGRGAILGFRPLDKVAGVVRVDAATGFIALRQGSSAITYVDMAGTSPKIIDQLRAEAGKQIIVLMGPVWTSADEQGHASQHVRIESFRRIEGLYFD